MRLRRVTMIVAMSMLACRRENASPPQPPAPAPPPNYRLCLTAQSDSTVTLDVEPEGCISSSMRKISQPSLTWRGPHTAVIEGELNLRASQSGIKLTDCGGGTTRLSLGVVDAGHYVFDAKISWFGSEPTSLKYEVDMPLSFVCSPWSHPHPTEERDTAILKAARRIEARVRECPSAKEGELQPKVVLKIVVATDGHSAPSLEPKLAEDTQWGRCALEKAKAFTGPRGETETTVEIPLVTTK